MADYRKNLMLKAMLGKKKQVTLVELTLPIAITKLNVFKEAEEHKYSAHCTIAQELPQGLNGTSLSLRGEEEGIAINCVTVIDTKKIEFTYAGTADITGSQEFFLIKEYNLLPLNKWPSINQAVWWAEKSKIAQIQNQLSPISVIADAINTLYRAEVVYKNNLKNEGKNRQAGDPPYNAKEALENVRIIEEYLEAIEPLEAVAEKYGLSPSASIGQVQAQLLSCWSASIQVALNMTEAAEFETIDNMDAEDSLELYNLLQSALDDDLSINSAIDEASGVDVIPEADLSKDAQDGAEGKPHGESTSEPPNESPGALGELSEEELEALTMPTN
jgi:hypothetical protein